MADMTVFEHQVEEVLRRAAGPSRPVDAVHVVELATASRWSVVTRRPRSGSAAPTEGGFSVFSAVKFVVAGVIVALFGGFLLAGILTTPQGDESVPAAVDASPTGALASCPPESTPDQPGPADQPRPPGGEVVAAAFDRDAGKIVYLAKADGAGETWLFDVCTNTWSLAQRGGPPVFYPISAVYDSAAGLTLAVSDGATWAYDSSTNSWTRRDAIAPEVSFRRLAYDAAAGRVVTSSGKAPYPVWSYDAEADAWQPVGSATPGRTGPSSPNRILTYDGTVDRLLAHDRGSVELFDEESGTWEQTSTKSPPIGYGGGYISYGGNIAYDEAVGRTVLVGADAVIAYDATVDEWELMSGTLTEPPGGPGRLHHKAIYDPINERTVMVGGIVKDPVPGVMWGPRDDVWAFDARTREWIELVPSLGAELE
jgi:hypothetical protein